MVAAEPKAAGSADRKGQLLADLPRELIGLHYLDPEQGGTEAESTVPYETDGRGPSRDGAGPSRDGAGPSTDGAGPS